MQERLEEWPEPLRGDAGGEAGNDGHQGLPKHAPGSRAERDPHPNLASSRRDVERRDREQTDRRTSRAAPSPQTR
jgi:hypothetical protein